MTFVQTLQCATKTKALGFKSQETEISQLTPLKVGGSKNWQWLASSVTCAHQ